MHGSRWLARPAAVVLLVAAALLAGCSGSAHGSGGSGGSTSSSGSPAAAGSASPGPGAADGPVTKLLVFVVENHSLDQMRTQMPKVFSLAQQYGYADDFYAVTHPSLPNYVVMTSGHLHGVTFDAPPSRWPLKGPSIFGRALDAGLTAKAYADAMPANCTLTDDGTYAVRHNPWTYFVDERDQCRRYDVPVAELDRDVAAGNLPNAGFVAPDLCHDAHNCGLDQADQWLGTELGTVLAGPDFRSGRLAVVVTADEDDHHEDNKILTVVMHPSQHGDVVHDRLDHYSLYGLYEDVLGLPHLPTDRPTGSMAKAFGLPVTGS